MQAQLLGRTSDGGEGAGARGTLVEQAAAWLQSLTNAMGEHLGKVVCPLWMSICNNIIAMPVPRLPSSQVGHAATAAAGSDDDRQLRGGVAAVDAHATISEISESQKASTDRVAEEELRALRRDREAQKQQSKLQSEQLHELRSACEREATALQHQLHQISAHHRQTQEALTHHARRRLGDELHQKLLAIDRSAAEHLSQSRERIAEQHRVLSGLHHDAQFALASLVSTVDSLTTSLA
jgi:flagellar biosynthesis GTPase FlhF